MKADEIILDALSGIIRESFGEDPPANALTLQRTRKEFEGDFTLVVYPFVKMARRSPEKTAEFIGQQLLGRLPELGSFNVIKGFLNLSLNARFWFDFLLKEMNNPQFGFKTEVDPTPVLVEYSSPNTNKPLHLGHVRNNLLGFSVAKILEAVGKKVVKVNLVNDRGIHICKSMLAWLKYGNGETPETFGKKGDKLVGDYYVRFESELKAQVAELAGSKSMSEEEARRTAPLMTEAQELLRKWELGDAETLAVWRTMNGWVYKGFDETYEKLGVSFEKIYYESETYLSGKDLVSEGLEKGVFVRRDDGSVWVDLSDHGLDEKLLLRSDGTSVYITQDMGTAQLRYNDFKPGKMIYVVGNEQNYHFEVLQKVLKKLGKPYANTIFHLSYGMVELPEGKMKSREGTVVDADELIGEMFDTARNTAEELGKIQDLGESEKTSLFNVLGMGALKYFILKVDPKKNMLFNPAESIDFNGNTGPFIQYTYARIRSILRLAGEEVVAGINVTISPDRINAKERNLLRTLYEFPETIEAAGSELNPAHVANYSFELCREYNQFYHEYSVLNEPETEVSHFRIKLSEMVARVIRNSMMLLGIDVPERM
ncbi:MAG TPA: arginine--tRNA ligase [Bacteroidales bacterium]|nr:arginine--tRNA ligase [Bacteroidales bacterium]